MAIIVLTRDNSGSKPSANDDAVKPLRCSVMRGQASSWSVANLCQKLGLKWASIT